MKISVFLLMFIISLSSCRKENFTKPKSKIVAKSSEDKYFGVDTLLIKRYTSDSGNEIELRGSESKDLFFVNVKTKSGKYYNYQIADSWYAASHSQIEWDNSEFVFIRQGCGTVCWNGKVLNITGRKKTQDLLFYLYCDSIKSYVAFVDSIDEKRLILKNLKSLRQTEINLDLCEEAVMPFLTIDTIFETSNNNLLIKYNAKNCRDKKEKLVKLP